MIHPPEGTSFIHGIHHWSKNHLVDFVHPEISVSIHKEGHTLPLRPIGFIVSIKEGGVNAAFDRDTASKLIAGKKQFSIYSRKLRNYLVSEFNQLIANTRKGKHNELWVESDKVEILSGYSIGNNKTFEKAMNKFGYEVFKICSVLGTYS